MTKNSTSNLFVVSSQSFSRSFRPFWSTSIARGPLVCILRCIFCSAGCGTVYPQKFTSSLQYYFNHSLKNSSWLEHAENYLILSTVHSSSHEKQPKTKNRFQTDLFEILRTNATWGKPLCKWPLSVKSNRGCLRFE